MVSKELDCASKKMEQNICVICHQEIEENDLVFFSNQNERGKGKLCVHFRCYLELQNKICCECGKPFEGEEELFLCEEHQEYFHSSKECLNSHLKKHLSLIHISEPTRPY